MALTDNLSVFLMASLIAGGKETARIGSLQAPHQSAGADGHTKKTVTIAAGATVTIWDIADYDSDIVPALVILESTLDVWGELVVDVTADGKETRSSFQIAAHAPTMFSSFKALTQTDESAHAGDTFTAGEEGRVEAIRAKNPSTTTAATVTLHMIY